MKKILAIVLALLLLCGCTAAPPETTAPATREFTDSLGRTVEIPSEINAIAGGRYYKTPYGPYGWLSSPPSVQRYLGMLWLGELLYPEYTEYDLQEEVTAYYKLFYGCDLTQELYQELLLNAMP